MLSDRNKTSALVVNKFHGQEIVGSTLDLFSASAHKCCSVPIAVHQLESLGFVCHLEVLFTFAVFPEQLAGRHVGSDILSVGTLAQDVVKVAIQGSVDFILNV